MEKPASTRGEGGRGVGGIQRRPRSGEFLEEAFLAPFQPSDPPSTGSSLTRSGLLTLSLLGTAT